MDRKTKAGNFIEGLSMIIFIIKAFTNINKLLTKNIRKSSRKMGKRK